MKRHRIPRKASRRFLRNMRSVCILGIRSVRCAVVLGLNCLVIIRYMGMRRKGDGPPSSKSARGIPMDVPCGQCLGCRLDRSRQWAIRCIHEAQMFGNKNVLLR